MFASSGGGAKAVALIGYLGAGGAKPSFMNYFLGPAFSR